MVDSRKNGRPILASRKRRIRIVGFESDCGFQVKPGVMGVGQKNEAKMRTRIEEHNIALCSRVCQAALKRMTTRWEYA